jgi:K+/H+ antiporter YhaU regulatory subunit KhtT
LKQIKQTSMIPLYLRIAVDIADRIVRDELKEGDRIYGRSVMASEYKTSPETIRRALKLLSDMKVVKIHPQSGVVVMSRDNATRYLREYRDEKSTIQIRLRISELMNQMEALNTELTDSINDLIVRKDFFATAKEPLPNYELTVPDDSAIIGKSVGELDFWQHTGCTVIAIRRGKNVIVSPGPHAEIYGGDTLLVVGTTEAVEKAQALVSEREKKVCNNIDRIRPCK